MRKRKIDYQKKFAICVVNQAMEQEYEHLRKATSAEEEEVYCKNIKALAEAYAAINGWC